MVGYLPSLILYFWSCFCYWMCKILMIHQQYTCQPLSREIINLLQVSAWPCPQILELLSVWELRTSHRFSAILENDHSTRNTLSRRGAPGVWGSWFAQRRTHWGFERINSQMESVGGKWGKAAIFPLAFKHRWFTWKVAVTRLVGLLLKKQTIGIKDLEVL